MDLTSKQRSQLRSLANGIDTILMYQKCREIREQVLGE